MIRAASHKYPSQYNKKPELVARHAGKPTPPNLSPGITMDMLTSGRAKPARRTRQMTKDGKS